MFTYGRRDDDDVKKRENNRADQPVAAAGGGGRRGHGDGRACGSAPVGRATAVREDDHVRRDAVRRSEERVLAQKRQLDERAGEQDLARAKQTAVFTVASNFLALVSQQVALEVRRVDRGSEERKSEERRALARFFRLSSSIGAAHVGAHQATPHRRRDAVPSRRGVAASSGGAHVVHAHGVARRRQ